MRYKLYIRVGNRWASWGSYKTWEDAAHTFRTTEVLSNIKFGKIEDMVYRATSYIG